MKIFLYLVGVLFQLPLLAIISLWVWEKWNGIKRRRQGLPVDNSPMPPGMELTMIMVLLLVATLSFAGMTFMGVIPLD